MSKEELKAYPIEDIKQLIDEEKIKEKLSSKKSKPEENLEKESLKTRIKKAVFEW